MSVCLFDNEDDFTQGGYVQSDYGEKPCRWNWDGDANSVTVRNSLYSRTRSLPGRNVREIPADEVREKVAAIVRDTYEDLQRNPTLPPGS